MTVLLVKLIHCSDIIGEIFPFFNVLLAFQVTLFVEALGIKLRAIQSRTGRCDLSVIDYL